MKFLKYLSFLLCILVSTSLFANDFRNSSWGDSIETVKKQEKKSPIDSNDNTLMYTGTLATLDVTFMYQFLDGKLSRGGYINQESYSNKTKYIDDYNSLKKLLIKKYGKPVTDETIWLNDLYKNDPSSWGTAISIGHLVFRAKWSTDATNILLALTGDNYTINQGIIYEEKATVKKREKIEESEALDQL